VGTWWLVGLDDRVVEVDGRGAVLAGPVPLPAGEFVVGASGAGLVLQPDAPSDLSGATEAIDLWDPASARVTRRITGSGSGTIAVDASTVAWASPDGTVHLTDASSGADRPVGIPGFRAITGVGAWSPSGGRLALMLSNLDGAQVVPAVIGLAGGAVELGLSDQLPVARPSTVAWTADGQRVFVTVTTSSPLAQVLTYRPGAGPPTYLRLPRSGVEVLAVVATS